MANRENRRGSAPALSFWLLVIFLIVLWVAGGASRADASGQILVRSFAFALLLIHVLTAPSFNWRSVRDPVIVLLGMALVVAFQLIPLPPVVWTELPGRELFAGASVGLGELQPWRPISISPGLTINALSSLIVPFTVVILAAGLTREDHRKLLPVLITFVVGGALLALVEFSGRSLDHPFINDPVGAVSGNIANRNHFALLLAIGLILGMVWAFSRQGALWKAGVALGLVLLLALTILATGSRSGMLLGGVSIIWAVFIVREGLSDRLSSLPRKLRLWAVIVAGLLLSAAIVLSIKLGRADAVERVLLLESNDDMRGDVWPVVVDMIAHYFPFGTGFGTFDPAFRISEPHTMLAAQYVNHAHNDWLEVVLDGGIAGAALAVVVLVWFVRRSYSAWFASPQAKVFRDTALAKAGSSIILLAFIASITDYPARTPVIMAMLALAAVWLTPHAQGAQPSTSRMSGGRRSPLR